MIAMNKIQGSIFKSRTGPTKALSILSGHARTFQLGGGKFIFKLPLMFNPLELPFVRIMILNFSSLTKQTTVLELFSTMSQVKKKITNFFWLKIGSLH